MGLRLSEDGHTRFAANDITTSGSSRTINDRRSPARTAARAARPPSTSWTTPRLQAAVARSEALMAAGRPDPEQLEGLGPQEYPVIPGFDEATSRAGRARTSRRRQGRARSGARSRARLPPASSRTAPGGSAIANKKGNFGFHRSTSAELLDHDADLRRHRVGIRRLQRPEAGRLRSGGPRRASRDQGGVVRPASRTSSWQVHRDSGARGRRRPPRRSGLRAQRSFGRGGAELPVPSRGAEPAWAKSSLPTG